MTSQTYLVRDAMFARVQAMPFFAGFTFAKNKALRVQTQDLPFCGVYLINELSIPDGDANAGAIRLRESARYGFSVVILDNDAEPGEETLDEAYQAITDGLLTDTTFTGFNNSLIGGITRVERMNVYGSVALDNETPILEMQLDVTADLGVAFYYPAIPDDFNTFHVDGHPIGSPDAPLVTAQWDMQTGGIDSKTKRGSNGKNSRKAKP